MLKQEDSSTRMRALRRTRRISDSIRWDKVLDARRRLANGTLDTPEVWRETLRRFAAED